jgi:hypothetical protein
MSVTVEDLVQAWRESNPGVRSRLRMEAHELGLLFDQAEREVTPASEPDPEANERWHRENNPGAPFINSTVEDRSTQPGLRSPKGW